MSNAWMALGIVAEVAGRYAMFADAGLRLELIQDQGGASARIRFEDIKQRSLEIDLNAGCDLSAFRGLVELEIFSFRNSAATRTGANDD